MQNDLVEALQLLIETSLAEVNTSLPGTIVSYDPATNRAIVRPDLPKRIANGDRLAAPSIVEVPLVWTASSGGQSALTMPVKPGDGVMLSFQQRSLEGWLSGVKDMPDDPRQFDLSDCVAIPGCQPSGISADPDDMVLKFGKAELRIQPDGTIILGNDKGNMRIDGQSGTINFSNGNTGISIDNAGNVGINGQTVIVSTTERTFILENHQHTNVQSGSGNSGPPLG